MVHSWIKSAPICSKGLFDNNSIIENTLPAIQKAVDCGYNLIINLSLTKDNRLVVCDSKKSYILLSCHKRIETISSDDKENLQLLGTTNCVPLLNDVLNLVNGKVGIIFKISASNKYKKIITELVKQLAFYKGKTAVVASSYQMYFFAKKISKNLLCGIILHKKSSKLIYNAILFANINFFKLLKPSFIICDIANLPNKYLDDYLLYNPYSFIIGRTVYDKSSYLTALNYADGFVFENYTI